MRKGCLIDGEDHLEEPQSTLYRKLLWVLSWNPTRRSGKRSAITHHLTCTRQLASRLTCVLGFRLLMIYGLVKITVLLGSEGRGMEGGTWGGGASEKKAVTHFSSSSPQSHCVSKTKEF